MRTWAEIERSVNIEIGMNLSQSEFVPKEYHESFKLGFVKSRLIVALIRIEKLEKQIQKGA